MSKSKIDKLNGKNVLVFDLETSGLPIRRSGYYDKMINAYYDYKKNKAYDCCRIVEVGWSYIENFDKDNIDLDSVKSFVRKPTDFDKIPNSEFHGITYKKAKKEGLSLSKILNKEGLKDAIENCDYVIAHSAIFDMYILLNELYRLKFNNTMEKLASFLNTDKLVCTAELGRDICKIRSMYGPGYKIPKLVELYNHYYNEYPKESHRASCDVKTVLMILQKI